MKNSSVKAKNIVGKVSDFSVVYGNGITNCCADDIDMRSDEDAYVGMVIQCLECNQTMILKSVEGKLRWTAHFE